MVVVVETAGLGGVVVVVCSVVVVRVTGGGGSEQPASSAMPASSARLSAWLDRLVVWVIVCVLEVCARGRTGFGPTSDVGGKGDYWTVVVLVVFSVVTPPPTGLTVVSVVEVRVWSVTTPLRSVDCSVVLELEAGAGVAPVVEDQVEVVLDEAPCASAIPGIIAKTAAAASQVLIIEYSYRSRYRAEIARCSFK